MPYRQKIESEMQSLATADRRIFIVIVKNLFVKKLDKLLLFNIGGNQLAALSVIKIPVKGLCKT